MWLAMALGLLSTLPERPELGAGDCRGGGTCHWACLGDLCGPYPKTMKCQSRRETG